MGDILTRDELAARVAADRAAGRTIAFANGCFDLLHVGHVRYLQGAAAEADRLVVAVNDDEVAGGKGPGRPILPARDRAELVAALRGVDYVVIFPEPDPLNLITALQPDVLVKGGDWPIDRIIGREVVEQRGGTVKTIPLVPGMSTTALIQRIRSQPH